VIKKKVLKKEGDSFLREFMRQTFHVGLGLSCAVVLVLTSLSFFQKFVVGVLLLGALVSFLAEKKWIPLLNNLLSAVERKSEHIPGQGAFLFVMGIGITAFLFPNRLPVLTGIVAYTFQDSFSTIFGIKFGKTRIVGKKTLEGSIAGLIGCVIPLSLFLPLPIAFVIAVVATIIELLPINDALVVPLASALMVVGLS
jgi:dolichol kinase